MSVTVANPFKTSDKNPLVYQPPSRCRSEASFSEFRYDNTEHPPAGVESARLQQHKAKNCNVDLYLSQMREVIQMTPQQQYNAQFERLEGPRLDPAKVPGMAGNMSKITKAKATILAHSEQAVAHHKQMGDKSAKVDKTRSFIMDIERKSPAACAPPPKNTNPLLPAEQKFDRPMKRGGYKLQESRWTWNESHEVTGQDPQFLETHSPEFVLEGLSAVQRKLIHSVKGDRKYNIAGAQDMCPAATKPYVRSDFPPSQRHVYENDRKHLQSFERTSTGRSKAVPKDGRAIEYLGESPEMWNCISGQERPLDTWRAMSARVGQKNWNKSAESFYTGNENTRTMPGENLEYPGTLNSPQMSARSLRSPASSQTFEQSQQYQDDTTRRKPRRSLLDTPSDAGSRVSRASYARQSVASSQRDLATPRWR